MATVEDLKHRLDSEHEDPVQVPIGALAAMAKAIGEAELLLLDSTYKRADNDPPFTLTGELTAVTPTHLIAVASVTHPIERTLGPAPGFPVDVTTTYRPLRGLLSVSVVTEVYPNETYVQRLVPTLADSDDPVAIPQANTFGKMAASIDAAVARLTAL